MGSDLSLPPSIGGPGGQTTGNVDYEAWGYVAAGLGPSKEALLLA